MSVFESEKPLKTEIHREYVVDITAFNAKASDTRAEETKRCFEKSLAGLAKSFQRCQLKL